MRQTGRTTKQMLHAPQGAHFVWCNEVLGYARHLARRLNRADLKIHPLSDLGTDRLRGLPTDLIVADHWVNAHD